MIYGAKFAWGHLPKTGGDATAILFHGAVFDLIEYTDALDTLAKHASFREREVDDREFLALNIRRLPAWTLSHKIQWARYGPAPDYVPLDLTKEQVIEGRHADRLLAGMIQGVTITDWLRMESLRRDFLAFVRKLRPITEPERRRVLTIPTKPPESYDHNVRHYFNEAEIVALYQNNPLWAEIEARCYGA